MQGSRLLITVVKILTFVYSVDEIFPLFEPFYADEILRSRTLAVLINLFQPVKFVYSAFVQLFKFSLKKQSSIFVTSVNVLQNTMVYDMRGWKQEQDFYPNYYLLLLTICAQTQLYWYHTKHTVLNNHVFALNLCLQ